MTQVTHSVSPPRGRRCFLRRAVGVAASGVLTSRASSIAAAASPRLRFGVYGINHEHIFRMVQAMRDGGGELAMAYAPDAEPHLADKFFQENPQVKRAQSERELLENGDLKLIVNAAPPASRARVGLRIMQAGKDCLADKGGILNLQDLAELRRVQAATKRIYAISYNERLLMPVSLKIDELLRAGAIGRVTQVIGVGPHGLTHNPREPWFWTRAGHGGILADVGTHQADQFLYYTGSTIAEVTAAQAVNRENPDHPEFEDFGEVTFKGNCGTGHATVSFYRKTSTGFLLTLIGTEGKMEVQKAKGLIALTKKDGVRKEIQANMKVTCPFGRLLVDDVLARTQTAIPQAHAFLASELAIRAQMKALGQG